MKKLTKLLLLNSYEMYCTGYCLCADTKTLVIRNNNDSKNNSTVIATIYWIPTVCQVLTSTVLFKFYHPLYEKSICRWVTYESETWTCLHYKATKVAENLNCLIHVWTHKCCYISFLSLLQLGYFFLCLFENIQKENLYYMNC